MVNYRHDQFRFVWTNQYSAEISKVNTEQMLTIHTIWTITQPFANFIFFSKKKPGEIQYFLYMHSKWKVNLNIELEFDAGGIHPIRFTNQIRGQKRQLLL